MRRASIALALALASALPRCGDQPPPPEPGRGDAPTAGSVTAGTEPARARRSPGDPVIRVIGGELLTPGELPGDALRVGVIGDSITQGGAFPERYSRTLERLLRTGAPRSVVEARGVAGETCGRVAERFDADILDREPPYDTVIIQCGINDLNNGQEPARIAAAIDRMIGWAEQAGLRVILLTTGPIWGHPGWDAEAEERREELNDWIRERAGVAVVDIAAVLAVGEPQRLRADFVHRDALHPNQDGHDEIAHAIWQTAFAGGWHSAGPGIRYRWGE